MMKRFIEMGHLLVLTDNLELNALICQRWAEVIDEKRLYRWLPVLSETRQLKSFVGTPIWSRLPKPSIISDEIARKNLQLVTTNRTIRNLNSYKQKTFSFTATMMLSISWSVMKSGKRNLIIRSIKMKKSFSST